MQLRASSRDGRAFCAGLSVSLAFRFTTGRGCRLGAAGGLGGITWPVSRPASDFYFFIFSTKEPAKASIYNTAPA